MKKDHAKFNEVCACVKEYRCARFSLIHNYYKKVEVMFMVCIIQLIGLGLIVYLVIAENNFFYSSGIFSCLGVTYVYFRNCHVMKKIRIRVVLYIWSKETKQEVDSIELRLYERLKKCESILPMMRANNRKFYCVANRAQRIIEKFEGNK